MSENSSAGAPSGRVSDSTPASSSACRGGDGSRTEATTPHSALTGSGRPHASAVQGPAATTTTSAACLRPPTSTPPGTARAASPISSRAPAASARAAHARVAVVGPTGRPSATR